MKLRHLKIENIASLRGKHFIEFDKLNEINLFAITGATGSGKSTILTAISLALYGKSHKKSLTAVDLITTGQAQGSVELSFSFKGSEYKACWRCKARKSNGEFLKTPGILRNFYINDQPTHMLPEDVLNLNFDQFSKTVILNQGEFSRFLLSNFNERKDILESLTSWDSLSHIYPNVKNSIKTVSNSIAADKLILENISIASNDEIEAIKNILPQQEEYIARANFLHETSGLISTNSSSTLELFKKHNSFNGKQELQIQSIQQEQKVYNNSLQILSNAEEKFQKSQNTYNREMPLLNEGISLIQKIKQSNIKYCEIKKNSKNESDSLMEFQHQIAETHKKIEKLNKEMDETASHEIQLAWNIIHENELAQHFKIIKELFSNTKVSDLSLNNIKNLITSLKVKAQSLQNDIKEIDTANDLDLPKTLSELDLLKRKKHQFDHDLADLNAAYKNHTALCQQSNGNISRIESLKSNERDKKSERSILERKVHLDELERSISICKQIAVESGDCPVCQNNFLGSDSENNQSIFEIEVINKSRLQLENLQKEITSYETMISESKDQLSEIEKKRMLESKKIKLFESIYQINAKTVDNVPQLGSHLAAQLERSITYKEDNLTKMRQLIEKKNHSQMIQAETFSEIEKNNSILDGFFNERKILDKTINEKIKTVQSELKIKIDKTDEFISYFENLQETGHGIVRIKNNLAECHTLLDSLKSYIKSSLDKIAVHSEMMVIEEELISCLNLKLNKLKIDRNPDSKKLELQEILNKGRSIKDQAQRDLHSKELLLNQSKQILKNIKDNISSITGTIQGDFNKLCELKKSVTHEAIILSPLNKSQIDHSEQLNFFITKLIELNFETSMEIIDGLFLELEKLDGGICEMKKESQIINESFIHNKFLIKTHRENRKKQEKIHKNIKSHEINLKRWKNLLLILGKNRDEFRNFALSLIEEKLTEQANVELENLCEGRYRIKTIPSTHGNDYYICDKYMGNELRKVSTLSGGEIFLISLAMALSLAELTRGKTEIDSFFIDEGFGTLDDDAIEEVIETLLSLRNRGKQIGLISHIQKLTNRVPVNIHLQKGHLGESHIEIVYH